MEKSYIVSNEDIGGFLENEQEGFRVEPIAGDMNLLHVRSDIVECSQMLLERMLYLDSMGMKISVNEMENLICDFYGIKLDDEE